MSDAYWADRQDPLGQIHGKEKCAALERGSFALNRLLLLASGHSEFAREIDLGMQHLGDAWTKAKNKALSDHQEILRNAELSVRERNDTLPS